mmetsp:Transcript_48582/g.105319  ORF Transcript_48582/g.105319 Transcript_48582/m.105319 type:complete len:223 (+) Transcript_48582:435-1103(+)
MPTACNESSRFSCSSYGGIVEHNCACMCQGHKYCTADDLVQRFLLHSMPKKYDGQRQQRRVDQRHKYCSFQAVLLVGVVCLDLYGHRCEPLFCTRRAVAFNFRQQVLASATLHALVEHCNRNAYADRQGLAVDPGVDDALREGHCRCRRLRGLVAKDESVQRNYGPDARPGGMVIHVVCCALPDWQPPESRTVCCKACYCACFWHLLHVLSWVEGGPRQRQL